MAEDKAPVTTDRLRHEIDSGRTGEKADWPDPAAAPLGTDDEASGNPPDSEQVREATPDTDVETPLHTSSGAALTYVALAAGLLVAIAVIVIWATG